ncbi:MAG: hypothetical protein JJT76_12245 [Clostridiaceae bacterium]|nr:hypothetical protein [Clostridiaceae bacterium]
MLQRILEKLDTLFTVKQTKYTGKRIFITFCLVVLSVFSLPIYHKYEDYTYGRYSDQYQQASSIIQEYYSEYGEYPVSHSIDWKKEKNLNKFFQENRYDRSRRSLYYVDEDLIPEIDQLRYNYLIDINTGTLYTREWVPYKYRRWHLAIWFND